MAKSKPVFRVSRAARYLIHNQGTELYVVSDACVTQEQFADALIEFLSGEDLDGEDTMHILSFSKKGPEITEFSSRFMEAAKFLASPEDPGWSEWDGTREEALREVYED